MSGCRLFVHIGTHKTGSSIIQHNLRHNKRALARQGFTLLRQKDLFGGGRLHEFTRADLDALGAAFSRKVGGDASTKYVVSSESLCGDPFDGYGNMPLLMGNLKRIATAIPVCVLVYVRRQDSFLESLYTQSIHQGQSRSFDDFLAAYPLEKLRWLAFAETLEGIFGHGRVIVRPYDSGLLAGREDILKDFFTQIGAETKLLDYSYCSRSENRGYSRAALEFARLCNDTLSHGERRMLRNLLQKKWAKEPFQAYGYFRQADRQAFQEKFSEDNRNVLMKYCGGVALDNFVYASSDDPDDQPEVDVHAMIPVVIKELLRLKSDDACGVTGFWKKVRFLFG